MHRAGVLQLRGSWTEAEQEAGRACEEMLRVDVFAVAEGCYAMDGRAQWKHSSVTGDKVYCVYIAEDVETVREYATKGRFRPTR